MPRFPPALRERLVQESRGKVVADLEWVEEDDCWVYTFTDGTEVAVRFMAEVDDSVRAPLTRSGA